MASRIWAVDLPSARMRITSRVMSMQSDQVAAWLVNVTRLPASAFT